MSEKFLEACISNEFARAEALIGLKIPHEWQTTQQLMALRLADCHADPAYHPWSLRAISLKATGEMVGHIGFHTKPNPECLLPFVPDGIEFGYTIFAEHQRKGYATEAIRGLIRWGIQQREIRHFVVTIAPANVASQLLAKKLGFVKVGEHQDEADGLEEVFVLAGDALRRIAETED